MAKHLIELCCGSAGLSLWVLGARQGPMPYQGSKWRYRRWLRQFLGPHPIDTVELYDVGPWGVVAPLIVNARARALIVAQLSELAADDPQAVYARLHRAQAPQLDPVRYAAEFLFLQRLAFSGKAVSQSCDGVWVSPGLNTTSAYGTPATAKFGAVNPMVPSLIRVLSGYTMDVRPQGGRGPAPHPTGPVERPTVVYLDPPYQGTQPYPDGHLDRAAVVSLALAWREAGARVVVSEAEPIPELVAQGWTPHTTHCGNGDSPFKAKHVEWVTISTTSGA